MPPISADEDALVILMRAGEGRAPAPAMTARTSLQMPAARARSRRRAFYFAPDETVTAFNAAPLPSMH